ncbi:hypothetical protein [Roseibium marinum]|uniref:4Fe-4S ferredoxin-type domain-containing protein n=1 Tax=Roseibium marinum TaxID=281252 RepID=A0A2S3US82_9HYPH|nr:hypothetical protein [Roseibium marinum]POF30587.1 hypothetical protein CLV41_106201 [Roseibium marinum]
MTGPAAELTENLAAAGFLRLGGFHPAPDLPVPVLSAGRPAQSLVLIGSTGPAVWPVFMKSPEYADGKPDPLDRYTKRVLSECAARHGFEALFPFEGPPYHPFQQWALKCGGFSPSPLGVLAHGTFGLWAGFRAAFLSAARLPEASAMAEDGPCPTCADKPCLSACPVNAITLENGYDVPACRAYLAADPASDCWSGCLARRACPFGAPHRQAAETAGFHMKSFAG